MATARASSSHHERAPYYSRERSAIRKERSGEPRFQEWKRHAITRERSANRRRARPLPLHADESRRLVVSSSRRAHRHTHAHTNKHTRSPPRLLARDDEVERTRHLAKASAIEALNAVEKQRDDNRKLADAIKHEGAAMGKQRKLEEDLKTMVNQQLVREVAHVRSHAPHEAKVHER